MKSFRISRLALLLALTSFIIYSCQSTKSATTSRMLRFGFEKGKGYDYEMIMSMDQEMGGQKVPIDVTTYYSMDVTGDDGTTKELTTTIDRFKMKADMMGMNLEIDTDQPIMDAGDNGKSPLERMNKLLGAIKGRKFKMKINAEGKVVDVSGFSEMAASMADSLNLNEADKQKMIATFSSQFSDEKTRNQFERFLYIFPNKEIKAGESWQRTTSGGPGGSEYHSTYTVKEIEGDMVTLEEKTVITGAGGVGSTSGTVNGEIVVDSRTGLIMNADQELNLSTNSNGKTFSMHGKTKVKGKAR